MSQFEADTCYCVVRHPHEAKFLVVRHEESWSPPVLKFPTGQIDFQVNQINQGMLDKYGLKTRVLRPILHLPNHHYIEMELAAPKSTKKLQAVWVDRGEYLRTRSPTGEVPDPFEIWFRERESGKVPAKRAPFHLPGWFEQADHWIHFQLDRLGIQVTGSVEQYRQGWNTSCLLRVPTNQGWFYFKAGFEASPGEAVLTQALAQRWPQHVVQPLALDISRNWMLNKDIRGDKVVTDLKRLPAFARVIADLQLDSLNDIDTWKSMGCRQVTLADYLQVCENPEVFRSRLQEGGGRLSDDEWKKLLRALQNLAVDCQVLAESDLPMTLVHTDFRDDNLVFNNGRYHILDWSEAVFSHPFLVLGRIMTDHRLSMRAEHRSIVTMNIGDELFRQILDAYLAPFAAKYPEANLPAVLQAVEKLDRLWMMLRMLYRFEWVDERSPQYFRLVVGLQTRARRLIASQAG